MSKNSSKKLNERESSYLKSKLHRRDNIKKFRISGIMALSMSGFIFGTTGLLATSITGICTLAFLIKLDQNKEEKNKPDQS